MAVSVLLSVVEREMRTYMTSRLCVMWQRESWEARVLCRLSTATAKEPTG